MGLCLLASRTLRSISSSTPKTQFIDSTHELYKPEGQPVTTHEPEPEPEGDEDDDSKFLNGFTWESVAIGYRFGMLFGLVIGWLIYTVKSRWVIRITEREQSRLGRRSRKRTSKRSQLS
ncbi:hypothetical protein Tco_0371953, partial [Tanacetum coccineum]